MFTIYVLIGLHFMSDFILQPNVVAKKKSSDFRYMLVHMLIIYAVFGIFCFGGDLPQTIPIIYVIIHGIQDKVIWSVFRQYAFRRKNSVAYIQGNQHVDDPIFWCTIAVDQCLHIYLLIYLFTGFH